MVQLVPQTVTSSRVRHAFKQPVPTAGCNTPSNVNGSSGNWSGIELQQTAASFGWVAGTWKVPSVTGESGQTSFSSTWVGIDGDGTADLVQTGTEQDASATDAAQVFTFRVWTEFLPQQPTESIVANATISPGDEIFAELSIANAGGSPDLSGFFGYFVIMNLTQGWTSQVYTQRGTTTVGGSEAEWIVERPTLGSSLTDLANYSTAQIYNATARRPNSPRHQGYVNCCDNTGSPSFLNMTMMNGTTNLSTVSVANGAAMNFTWQAFH
jgi:hypothetical protein